MSERVTDYIVKCWRSSPATEEQRNLRRLCFLWFRHSDGNDAVTHGSFQKWKKTLTGHKRRHLCRVHRNPDFFTPQSSRLCCGVHRSFPLPTNWNMSWCFLYTELFSVPTKTASVFHLKNLNDRCQISICVYLKCIKTQKTESSTVSCIFSPTAKSSTSLKQCWCFFLSETIDDIFLNTIKYKFLIFSHLRLNRRRVYEDGRWELEWNKLWDWTLKETEEENTGHNKNSFFHREEMKTVASQEVFTLNSRLRVLGFHFVAKQLKVKCLFHLKERETISHLHVSLFKKFYGLNEPISLTTSPRPVGGLRTMTRSRWWRRDSGD